MTIYTAEQLHQKSTFDNTYDSMAIPRVYQVFTNDVNTSEVDILNASGLPQLYDKLPGSDNIIVRRRSGEKQAPVTINGEIGALWTVTITYELPNPGENTKGDDPTTGLSSRLINFNIDFNTIEITLDKAYQAGDSFGNPSQLIVNKAGQAIDPPLRDYKYNMVLRWTQKEDNCYQYSSVKDYIGTVNNQAVTILGINIPAYQGLMKKINPVYKYDQIAEENYFETTYEVEIDIEEHRRKVPNIGFRQLNNEGELVDIVNEDISPNTTTWKSAGEATAPIKEAAQLDNNGHLNLTATLYPLTFQTKFAQDWSALNLMSNIW